MDSSSKRVDGGLALHNVVRCLGSPVTPPEQIDALMFVKGSYDISGLISGAGKGWCTEQFAGGADKTGKVHSGEGKLL